MTINKNPISNPTELRTRREILEVFWRKGISGSALLQENTSLIDKHLQQNFANCPASSSKMCLVALGGYGRSELFPFSDIDLLLLHDPTVQNELGPVAEAILYPLWDAGLEVGHSVRTIDTCLIDAKDDFFFQVAMLDARHLAGSRSLFETLQTTYCREFIEGRRHGFLEDMICHRAERHRRFGKHIYQLEPQIKESRGGLRDMQAMIWTAHVVFGLKDLKDIFNAGLLNNDEYDQCLTAWNHLIRIRNRLHYISSRKNDRLYFEHQQEIAKAFNYKAGKGMLEVEHFMRDVYGHMQTIAVTADLFFEHADEVIRQGAPTSPQLKGSVIRLEDGIELRKSRIYLSPNISLADKPELLMKVFSQAAKTKRPIHYLTRKQISANLNLITEDFRSSPVISKYFLKIVGQPSSSTILQIMLESGFLAAYLPEFNKLKSLAQHDIYHVSTVDHHQIQTVATLHTIIEEKNNVFQDIKEPHILFLAALIHDIGKGRGGDHSKEGARLAAEIGHRLNLKSKECYTLSFLVLNHLFLVDNAMHRDLEDEGLIKQCSATVQSHDQLAMLFLLSIADAKATGPTVWNAWKEALLLELYLKVGLQLDKSGGDTLGLSQGIEWIREKVSKILNNQSAINLQDLPDDYLLSFSPEEIASHIQRRNTLQDQTILIDQKDSKDHCSLQIMTLDRPGLLANLCGVLALHNLKVLAAQIFTWPDGTVVDIINVQSHYDSEHGPADITDFEKDLGLVLNFKLSLDHRLNSKNSAANKGVVKGLPQQDAVVTIDNNSSSLYTIIEVTAQDSAGLLYTICKTLSYFQINIFRAKIGSRSDQVVDVFYVQNMNGNKLTESFLVNEIKLSIIHAVTNM